MSSRGLNGVARKTSVPSEDISSTFMSMFSISPSNFDVAIVKFRQIQSLLKKIGQTLTNFNKTAFASGTDQAEIKKWLDSLPKDEIPDYLQRIEKVIKDTSVSLNSTLNVSKLIDTKDFTAFNTLYSVTYKQSKWMKDILIARKQLEAETALLEDKKQVEKILARPSFTILQPITNIDFVARLRFLEGKSQLSAIRVDYLNSFLRCMRKHLDDMYRLILTPDVDKTRITEDLMQTMKRIEGMSRGRFSKGFLAIQRSAKMFENNFERYYSEYVHTGNASVLFTMFGADLSTASKSKRITMEINAIFKFALERMAERGGNGTVMADAMKSMFGISDDGKADAKAKTEAKSRRQRRKEEEDAKNAKKDAVGGPTTVTSAVVRENDGATAVGGAGAVTGDAKDVKDTELDDKDGDSDAESVSEVGDDDDSDDEDTNNEESAPKKSDDGTKKTEQDTAQQKTDAVPLERSTRNVILSLLPNDEIDQRLMATSLLTRRGQPVVRQTDFTRVDTVDELLANAAKISHHDSTEAKQRSLDAFKSAKNNTELSIVAGDLMIGIGSLMGIRNQELIDAVDTTTANLATNAGVGAGGNAKTSNL